MLPASPRTPKIMSARSPFLSSKTYQNLYEPSSEQAQPVLTIRQPTTLEVVGAEDVQHNARPPFSCLDDSSRGHLVAMVGEFIGTTMFLFFGFLAAQTANEKVDNTLRSTNGLTPMGPSLIQIAYISSVFGLSLAVNVFIWYRVSGGMFNPAISFGLFLAGAFNWVRLVCVIPAQLLGGIAAAKLVSEILPGPLQAENSVGPGISTGVGLVVEAFLTFELMMTILFLAVEKSRVSFLAPGAIGVTVLIIHLVGINVSGASVNPARTLGPALVNNHFVPEFWIYFVGPVLGATAAAAAYGLMKAMGYESANAGQDGDGLAFYRVVASSDSQATLSYRSSVEHNGSGSPFWPIVPAATARYYAPSLPSSRKGMMDDYV